MKKVIAVHLSKEVIEIIKNTEFLKKYDCLTFSNDEVIFNDKGFLNPTKVHTNLISLMKIAIDLQKQRDLFKANNSVLMSETVIEL
jgi:hypothetical protein